MRTRTNILAALLLTSGAVAGVRLAAPPATFAPAFDIEALDRQAGQRAQMESMAVSERHELLDYFVGDWDMELELGTHQAGQQPPPVLGRITFESILGGRFVRGTSEFDLMGQRMVSDLTLGFDTFANRYDITMLNSLSTATLRATGTSSQAGDAIYFYGPMDEPSLGLRARTVRYTWRLIDENTFRVEVDDLAVGEEHTRALTMTHTRVLAE